MQRDEDEGQGNHRRPGGEYSLLPRVGLSIGSVCIRDVEDRTH